MKKLLGLIALFSLEASAVVLTWEDCLNFTVQGNQALESSRRDWLAAKQTEMSAWGKYYPSLSVSTSITKIGATGATGGGGVVVTNGVIVGAGTGSQVNTNYLAQLNFNQNLFNGLEDQARINQAEWQTKTSYWKYVSAKAQVSFSLKEAFANLQYAQELKELNENILQRRESNYRIVSARYETGRENKGSVQLAEAYMEQAKLDVIKAEDSLKVAQTALKSLMNKEHLDTIEVQGEIPLSSVETGRNDFETLAVETPAYFQSYTSEMASVEAIKISRAAFLPDLNLTGIASRQGTSYFPDRERWQVGLTLTIPIFDGFRDMGTYKSSIETKYANESRRRSTVLDQIPKLRDAFNLAKQSDIKYRIDSKFREASSSRAEIARKKYNTGLLTFEDWDIIENELITRQTNYLASKRDRVLRYANWENLLGKGSVP